MFIYFAVVLLVMGDMIAYYFINKKRLAIDTSNADGKAREQLLRKVLLILHLHTFALALILIFVVKPLLAQ